MNTLTRVLAIVSIAMMPTLLAEAASAKTVKTLADVQMEFHGGDPLNPRAGSLLRQFLDETNNEIAVRTFPNSPAGSQNPPHRQGPQKLAISVGPNSIARFASIFSAKNYFFILHTPMSHTFQFIYRGHSGSYASVSANAPTFYAQSTIMMPILLSDAEADRLVDFFALTAATNANYTRSPWVLTGPQGPYSATSDYIGCTNWVGQLPLGDQTVDEYYFPAGAGDPDGTSPHVARLNNYSTPTGFTQDQDTALRKVWKVPGQKQLGEMLDPMAMRRGEFANVGWITYTALGSLTMDRAPAMFYQVNDATQELGNNFPLNIDAVKQ